MDTPPLLQIILPHGALGDSADDSVLDRALRSLAVQASPDPEGEWASKYGTLVDNAVFMMHPFCWCEQDDCPWCVGCTCPASAFHYFWDGHEVSYDAWVHFRRMTWDDFLRASASQFQAVEDENAAWQAVVESRSRSHQDAVCDFCLGTGIFSPASGALPGMGAPNFWHKPSGLRVWWYKYIGRGMVVQGDASPAAVASLMAECFASLS